MPDPIDIETLAAALGIPVRPEWHDTIRANLEISIRLGQVVAEVPVGDDTELAPVFRA